LGIKLSATTAEANLLNSIINDIEKRISKIKRQIIKNKKLK
jgi:hypothetical protein